MKLTDWWPPAAAVVILCTTMVLAGCRQSEPTTPRNSGDSQPSTATTIESVEAVNTDLQLSDVTAKTGITFVHTNGSSGQRFIMETVSCGLALLDYDNDGRTDIYFANGAPLDTTATGDPPRHALYRNMGDWQFHDVTKQAGIMCGAFGLGVTASDYDNDGFTDIYLSNYGPNRLYHNNGDGTFTDVGTQSPVARGRRVGAGTCFADVDSDGDLDLFAANYVQFDVAGHRAPARRGRVIYPGPLDYPQETNSLFRNNGDGHWTDISQTSGIASKRGTGMGAVCGDFDDDGDTDIYVANDEMANYLYRNDGGGHFGEVAIYSGAAYDDAGAAQGSMGVDCADFDNDGRLDLFVTAYQGESATLYRCVAPGAFQDVTRLTKAGRNSSRSVTWGCCFVDLDNDGDRDLFVARGHLDDRDENSAYRVPNLVLQNRLIETGTPGFVDITLSCGDGMRAAHSSRGAAVDDLDNDGDLDIVVLNSREPPCVLRNRLYENGSANHWLQLKLRGRRSNRNAVGTRVRLFARKLELTDEVHAGRGYQSHWGELLHFGLGHATRVDRVEVRWANGTTQVIADLPVDRCVTVVETTPLDRS